MVTYCNQKLFLEDELFRDFYSQIKMIWIAFIVNLLAEIQFWESPDKDDISIAKIQTFLIFDEKRKLSLFLCLITIL